jgi:sugar (pentulose or hexulose) kinase
LGIDRYQIGLVYNTLSVNDQPDCSNARYTAIASTSFLEVPCTEVVLDSSGTPMILVVNLGLKSVRCIVYSLDGAELVKSSLPIQTLLSSAHVEQSPEEWKSKTWQVIRSVTDELGASSSSIKYVTVTTSASCLVALDEDHRPIGNSILVSDTRARAEARLLSHTVEFQTVIQSSGAKCSPDLMLPKILWLLRHDPSTFKKARFFVNAGDYLNYLICGEVVTDENNALKFHYDLSKSQYPGELLQSIGLDEGTMPRVAKVGEDLGPPLASVCDELGLPKKCRLILTTYDALVAAAGTGAFEVGDGVDVSGTVTSFRVVTDLHVFDKHERIYVNPHFGGSKWLAGGSNNLGGGIVEWLRQMFFEDHRAPYDEIERIGSELPPCPGGALFLPYLLGERAPLWNPDCRGVFFGLNRAHGRDEMVKVALEGIAFSVLDIAEVLRSLFVDARSVRVSGGLSRLDSVNQIKADMLGVPVKRLDNFETTAIGAAILGIAGAEQVSDLVEMANTFCSVDKEYEPDTARHDYYKDFFSLYRSLYSTLKPVFADRAELVDRNKKIGIEELSLKENL